ncbi:MAG: metallophosphoesterase [Actinomycetota bacterium]
MRIAVVSDIHGNLPALESVVRDIKHQGVDQIWCGGDLAWAGPWAEECIAFVRAEGWATVRGNTDVWITGDPQTVDEPLMRAELETFAAAHDISADDAAWLLNLPLGHSPAGSVLLVHGTPESPFVAPVPEAPAAEFAPYAGRAALVLFGHVHVAFTRRLADGTVVCNTGSVGLPADGDTACYLLLDMNGAELSWRHRRVAFDRARALEQARRIGGPVGDRFVEKLQATS